MMKMCLAAALAAISLGGPVDPDSATQLSAIANPFLPTYNGPLFPQPVFMTGGLPVSVASGDLDGDGRADLAVANNSSGTVSVLMGNGNGTFAEKVDYPTGVSPFSIVIGDVDADGKADLVVANRSSRSVSVLRNNGNGTFAAKVDYPTGNGPIAVALGDLDGDGQPDIVTANIDNNSVSVLRNIGNGTYALKVDYATGNDPRSVAMGDLDGDDNVDLCVANYNEGGASGVSVLRNNGNGTFAADVGFATGNGPSSVAIRDLDGDGKAEVVVANQRSGSASILRNTGSAEDPLSFGKIDFATGSGPSSVSIGDISGDGKPDLAVANQSSSSVSILQNQSNVAGPSFAPKVDYPASVAPSGVAISDLNGDGKVDLVLVSSDYFSSRTLSVLLNKGSGAFAARENYATGSVPRILAVGDLTGNGRADVVVANSRSNSITVSVLLNSGNGTYGSKVDYRAGVQPYGVAVGDLNGDGRADLAVANHQSSSVSVLRSNGNGAFAAKVDYATGVYPMSVAIGDLNGDGRADLVVVNYLERYPGSVSVLMNMAGAGFGTFAPRVDYATGGGPYSVAVSDIDGDGSADLVVANSTTSNVSVLRNHGDGTFEEKVDFATGINPVFVAAGKLNGDDKPELVVANAVGETVSVLWNESAPGTVNFAAAREYIAGYSPSSVAIGDLDGDGHADLAVSNYQAPEGGSVSVLRNNGNGTFAAKVDYAASGAPYSVAIGDVDSDGSADLIVANSSSSRISVLRNQSSNAACLADLNGDGTVNTPDLTFFLGRFGQPATPGSPAQRADFNSDGVVDMHDLTVFLGQFGRPC